MRGHRAPAAVVPRLVLALLVVVLVAGCGHGRPAPTASGRQPAPPRLGGPVPARHEPPDRSMDRLERPLAARLARRIAAQGLSLAYLDCPRWDGRVPSAMTCTGYVDGLLADVSVRLWVLPGERARRSGVGFDARLGPGLVVTARLERTLRDQGWADGDCGAVPAYPAAPRTRIVCRVRRTTGSRASYVVATVLDDAGAVRIGDATG